MDRYFIVLVFAAVISTACTVHKPLVNPFQNVEHDASEELDNAPLYPNVPEESEQYFNPRLYGLPPYGYRHVVAHPSRRRFSGDSFGSGYRRSMYVSPGLQHKWRAPYPQQYQQPYSPPAPAPMAYWLSKLSKNSLKQPEVPLEQNTTNKTSSETTPSTTITTTTTTVAPEPIPEVTTEIVEIRTTEAPEEQTEEPAEEPKQRQLPINNFGKDCGSGEESTEAHTTVANEEQPTTAIAGALESVPIPQVTTGKVPASSTEVVSSSAEATSSEEEVVPMATLRYNSIPVLSEMAVPAMYPGKHMYGPAYFMPYLPAMPMDPYDTYRRISHHEMFQRPFYDY